MTAGDLKEFYAGVPVDLEGDNFEVTWETLSYSANDDPNVEYVTLDYSEGQVGLLFELDVPKEEVARKFIIRITLTQEILLRSVGALESFYDVTVTINSYVEIIYENTFEGVSVDAFDETKLLEDVKVPITT